MGVHDWTRADDGLFHDFHNRWIGHLTERLNGGLLPKRFYARGEQYYGQPVGDVLTLFVQPESSTNGRQYPTESEGGVAVAVAPPQVRVTKTIEPGADLTQRTLVVRHTSGNKVIAVIEVVSRGNKDGRLAVEDFVEKIVTTLRAGVHVVVLDLLPPTRSAELGLHVAITRGLKSRREDEEVQPADRPAALLSYCSRGKTVQAYLDFTAIGEDLPSMPLFLTAERYVNLPLASTYDMTYHGLGEIDRDRLDKPRP